jgi:ketosteroid isomerase-like protein
MSEENVELIRGVLERFVSTGEPPWDVLHEEIEVHDHDIMDADDYRGHAGFGHWMEDWSSAWSEDSIEAEDFLDADERVVVFIRQRTTGRGSGVALEREDAMVFEVGWGKITRVDYYNDRQQALRAVGLEG